MGLTAVRPSLVDAIHRAKLTAPDGADGDRFGGAVALDGDTAIVGAASDDTTEEDTGSAYVFVRSGTVWTPQAKLTGTGPGDDSFGGSVAIDGDTAVIGAPDDDPGGYGAGSAYVFARSGTTWSLQGKLVASDRAPNDRFGRSVAVSGNAVAVGAWANDTMAGRDAGSAYVFIRSGSTWTQRARLFPSDAMGDDWFGWSVAMQGDTVVAGAMRDDTQLGADTGSAYVFVLVGGAWRQQSHLVASDGAHGDWFGTSIDLDADTAVVGAELDDDNRGSAYVFVRTEATLSEQAKLTAPDGVDPDDFGGSVSVDGDAVIVGAFQDSTPAGQATGSAYLFTRSGDTWTPEAHITAPDAADHDYFGSSVALDGETAVVGALQDDTLGGSDAGSAWVFWR